MYTVHLQPNQLSRRGGLLFFVSFFDAPKELNCRNFCGAQSVSILSLPLSCYATLVPPKTTTTRATTGSLESNELTDRRRVATRPPMPILKECPVRVLHFGPPKIPARTFPPLVILHKQVKHHENGGKPLIPGNSLVHLGADRKGI